MINRDQRCLDILVKNYKPIAILGKGVYGITLECESKGQPNLVVKIQKTSDVSKNEVYMGNFINSLKENIPGIPDILTQTYSTLTCNTIPESYVKFIIDKKPKYKDFINELESPYIFIVMPKNEVTLADLLVTPDESKTYMFIMLLGLMVIRTYYPWFNHRDIKSDNIMFVKNPKPMKFVNEFGTFEMDVPYLPKLIDYGRMTNTSEPDCNRIEYEEYNYFELVQPDKGGKSIGVIARGKSGIWPTNDVFRIARCFASDEWIFKDIESYNTKFAKMVVENNDQPWEIKDFHFIKGYVLIYQILHSNFFDNCPLLKIRWAEQEPPLKRVKSYLNAFCNSCYSQGVTMKYENTKVPCFFCNEKCEKKFGVIKFII